MTDAERQARRHKKHGPKINRARRKQRKDAKKTAKRAADVAQRNANEAEMAAAAEHASAQLAKAERVFPFILADPPTIWMGGQGRVAPYDRMTIEAICAIRVRERAAADAVLWLWSTRPLLIKAPHRIIRNRRGVTTAAAD